MSSKKDMENSASKATTKGIPIKDMDEFSCKAIRALVPDPKITLWNKYQSSDIWNVIRMAALNGKYSQTYTCRDANELREIFRLVTLYMGFKAQQNQRERLITISWAHVPK